MQTGFYNAVGGIVTQFNRLDIISNNLANVNTNGFKRDDVVIGDFQRLYKESQDELPLHNDTKEAAKYLNRALTRVPQIVEEYSEHTIGNLQKTDNKLDFAITRADSYFAVETPEGIRFTRDGAFSLDADSKLVTKEGFYVLSSLEPNSHITLQYNKEFSTDKDGNIFVGKDEIASIGVFQSKNPKYMTKEGGNLLSAEKIEEMVQLENNGAVSSGYIEKSNVNAIKEMSALIETNRLVEFYSKVMKTHSEELDEAAISRLSNTKA